VIGPLRLGARVNRKWTQMLREWGANGAAVGVGAAAMRDGG
jgi:hypothetical protein